MSDVAPSVAGATTDLYNALGPIPSFGAGDAVAGYPLLRFLDGLGQILQRLNDLALDDLATDDPGWSILLDPTRCPTYGLPWLYQCAGGRFSPAENTDALQRAAITSRPSWLRGTVPALQAAAAPYLQEGQQVLVYERDTSPYHLTVVVSTAFGNGSYDVLESGYDSYNAIDGAFDSYEAMAANFDQGGITAALQAAKAGSLVMAITFTAGSTYAVLDNAFDSYDALDAAFSTYAAESTWTP